MPIILAVLAAALTFATLYFHLGALALVVTPLAGLFLLLTLTPVWVESLEREAAAARKTTPVRPVPTTAVDTSVRWGVLYIADR